VREGAGRAGELEKRAQHMDVDATLVQVSELERELLFLIIIARSVVGPHSHPRLPLRIFLPQGVRARGGTTMTLQMHSNLNLSFDGVEDSSANFCGRSEEFFICLSCCCCLSWKGKIVDEGETQAPNEFSFINSEEISSDK